mmetsp:Transcript_2674/g.3654  ORF Transcript_2674/g.3654 Transcript_2674/m.3654 type:complete len:207 (+) Transcript_2674:145-765(+)
MNGYIRLLPQSIYFEHAEALFDVIIENGWRIDCINESLCMNSMSKDCDIVVLRRVLSSLGSSNEKETSIWTLDRDKVLRLLAHVLFYIHVRDSSTNQWPVEDFLTYWSIKSPISINFESSADFLLRGIALKVTESTKVPYYHYLPVEQMSKQLSSRLQQLFSCSPQRQFRLEDLEPYLEGLVAVEQMQETLLTHCKFIDARYALKE